MAQKVGQTRSKRGQVLRGELGLGDAAVHLERADGGDHHAGRRPQVRETALDVEELLRPEIGAESRLGDDVIAQLHGRARRHDGIATVCDVGERAAVDEGRRAFQRLDKIGLQRILQKGAHRPRRLEIARRDGFSCVRVADDDAL